MATTKQLQTLMTKTGYDKEARNRRIYAWTAGRTQRGSALEQQELNELFAVIKIEYDQLKTVRNTALRKKRSEILTLATKEGILSPNNWEGFNHFMLHKSTVKKSLYLCSFDELELVYKQFKAIERNNDQSAQTPGTKAWHHERGFTKPSSN